MRRKYAVLVLVVGLAVRGPLPAQPLDCRQSFDQGKLFGAEHQWPIPPIVVIVPSILITGVGGAAAMGLANPEWYAEASDLEASVLYPCLLAAACTGLTALMVSLLYLPEPETVPEKSAVDLECYLKGYRRGARQANIRRTVLVGVLCIPIFAVIVPLFGMLASAAGSS